MHTEYFKQNCKYSVMASFSSGLSHFVQGEVVTYISGGYSRYDDCFIYEFLDENGQRKVFISDAEYDQKNQNLFNLLA